MKIRHREHGEVEVERYVDHNGTLPHWQCKGADYFAWKGWSEVPETRRVDVTVECFVEPPDSPYTSCAGQIVTPTNWLHTPVPHLGRIGLGHGYKWSMVDRYDLPDLSEVWTRSCTTYSGFERFLMTRNKPSLIIEKEESSD